MPEKLWAAAAKLAQWHGVYPTARALGTPQMRILVAVEPVDFRSGIDLLDLSFGTKVEYHTLGGWQYQPNVRAIWKPRLNQRWWASFSRATRTPSRGEVDADVRFIGVPALQSIVVLEGNPELEPEEVLSYEIGYRTWPKKDFYLDIAAFYNDYDDLRLPVFKNIRPGTIALQLINGERATAWGVELAADWRPFHWSRFHLAYTFLETDFEPKSGTATSG